MKATQNGAVWTFKLSDFQRVRVRYNSRKVRKLWNSLSEKLGGKSSESSSPILPVDGPVGSAPESSIARGSLHSSSSRSTPTAEKSTRFSGSSENFNTQPARSRRKSISRKSSSRTAANLTDAARERKLR